MLYNDILSNLQILTERARISQKEIAKSLGVSKQAINNRKQRGQHFSDFELKQIGRYFDVDLVDYTEEHNKIIADIIQGKDCTCSDQYDIQYIKYLPEEAKLPEITSVHIDLEIITAHWRRNAENLRIVPMPGNRLNTYAYPIQNRDILIVDTASTDVSKEGIYLFSTMNNSILYVAKLSMKLGGEILIEWNENNEPGKKEVSLERQKEVDMRILGRIIKNVSMTV